MTLMMLVCILKGNVGVGDKGGGMWHRRWMLLGGVLKTSKTGKDCL